MSEKILTKENKGIIVMWKDEHSGSDMINFADQKVILKINKAHSPFWYQAYVPVDQTFGNLQYNINSITVDFDISCEKTSQGDYAGCRVMIACEEEGGRLRTVYLDENIITEQPPLTRHISYSIDSSRLGPETNIENLNYMNCIGISAGLETSYDIPEIYHFENFKLTVNYTAPQKILTIKTNPENSGRVEGAGSYDEGTEAEALAYTDNLWRFMSWDDGVTENPRKIIMDKDKTFTAIFEKLMNVYVGNVKVRKIYRGLNEIKTVYSGNKII